MNIVIGCDETALEMKEAIKQFLSEKGYAVLDKGVHSHETVLYPDIAVAVAQAVKDGEAERGILMCGTGIGMAMTANKVPGIRAAVCHDPYSAERSRKSNDAQIMCMGARVIGIELAKTLTETWLSCNFCGGASATKIERMMKYEHDLT